MTIYFLKVSLTSELSHLEVLLNMKKKISILYWKDLFELTEGIRSISWTSATSTIEVFLTKEFHRRLQEPLIYVCLFCTALKNVKNNENKVAGSKPIFLPKMGFSKSLFPKWVILYCIIYDQLIYLKAVPNWPCQYLSFLNILFNRFGSVEKCGVTALLLSWFINLRHF